MKKLFKYVIIPLLIVIAALFVWFKYVNNSPFDTSRPGSNATTITELPDFPGLPWTIVFSNKEKQDEFVRGIVDHKLTTYPTKSSSSYRTGKFDATGIFGSFEPTEEQVSRVAINYDNTLLGANKKHLLPIFRKYNPAIKSLLYIDAGLNLKFAEWKSQADIGSIDEEGTFWIAKNHPEWLLKDAEGNPIVTGSGGELSNAGTYWPDPGNVQWQEFFAKKLNKLLLELGGGWDAILIDDFFGTREAQTGFTNTAPWANYQTDAAYQNAWIEFFTNVRKKIPFPFVANLDGVSVTLTPDFFSRLAIAAGGIEMETYPEEYPIEDFRRILEEIKKIPKNVRIHVNSKPSPGWAGNVDKTLFAYYSFLLFADRDREAYWTYKEWVSDIPHYWYKEFDLNLGNSLGDAKKINELFVREFENAMVVVNADNENAHNFERLAGGPFYDVAGNPMTLPITLEPRSAVLVVKNRAELLGTGL